MSNTIEGAPPRVVLYTKAGCPLCDEARDMLDEIASEVAFVLDEVDIRSDMELFAQYRYRIPVIIRDETVIAEGRIDYDILASALSI